MMWLVRIALRLPYTFVVATTLIVLLGAVSIRNMAKDVVPATIKESRHRVHERRNAWEGQTSSLHSMSASMIAGELMDTQTPGNDIVHIMGRVVVGGAGLLLLISAGLELFAQHPDKGTSIGGELLAIFLAFWSYVLGVGALLFLLLLWLVKWRRIRLARAAMSRYATGGSTRRRSENPALRDVQSLHHGVTPTPSCRLFQEGDDGKGTNSLTRVG